jgi:pyrimidine-nucleoside phosphorylase
VAIVGQTKQMVGLDKLLYALRDVTATVPSIPLIAASIMSKKLASGADGIVLDVKVGNGSFMNDLTQAKELATTMVKIGQHFGKQTIAQLSDMNQPLGSAVGNALEVEEAIQTLKGHGPEDFTQLCLSLATSIVEVAGIQNARAVVEDALASGKAYERFETFVAYQGGDLTAFATRTTAPVVTTVNAPRRGVVSGFATKDVGRAAMLLGAGRQTKDDVIDMAVGVMVKVKIGQAVKPGDVLFELHSKERRPDVEALLLSSVTLSDTAAKQPLLYDVIR